MVKSRPGTGDQCVRAPARLMRRGWRQCGKPAWSHHPCHPDAQPDADTLADSDPNARTHTDPIRLIADQLEPSFCAL